MSDPTIKDIEKMEAEVIANIRGTLGELASMPEEMANVHRELGRAFVLVSDSFTDHQVISFMFLLSSLRHQLLIGCLALMRGHPTDSTMYTRKAIEITAFCLEILGDSESGKRWMETGESKSARDRYTNRFPAWKVVTSQLKGRDKELVESYELYCLMVHPGLASVSRQAALEGGTFPFDHFEVSSQEHHDHLKAQYLMALSMHLRMSAVLASRLEEMKLPLAASYHQKFSEVQSKIGHANQEFAHFMSGKKQG